ncbi:MAG: hypothetical protein WCA77_00670 [Thermoplasmata archaeon]
MPAKVDEAHRRRNRAASRAGYHRPPLEDVATAARRVLVHPSERFRSLRALREAVLPVLRRRDPRAALGGRRLRAILFTLPNVRVDVRYRTTQDRGPMERCPVCSSALRPIQNRTLDEGEVILGYRCTRCSYWTHREQRRPVRYAFRVGSS